MVFFAFLGWFGIPLLIAGILSEKKEEREDLTLYQFQQKMIKLGYLRQEDI